MCRNIKPLFNYDPPVTPAEVHEASLQFVRKISGFHKPSRANQDAFETAVEEIAGIARRLLESLSSNVPPRSREEWSRKAKLRAAGRFSG